MKLWMGEGSYNYPFTTFLFEVFNDLILPFPLKLYGFVCLPLLVQYNINKQARTYIQAELGEAESRLYYMLGRQCNFSEPHFFICTMG